METKTKRDFNLPEKKTKKKKQYVPTITFVHCKDIYLIWQKNID